MQHGIVPVVGVNGGEGVNLKGIGRTYRPGEAAVPAFISALLYGRIILEPPVLDQFGI